MTDPFLIVLAFALGWVACHLVGSLVHALRTRSTPGGLS
jgi:hypothetical protein